MFSLFQRKEEKSEANNITDKNVRKDKVRGSLIGGAVGDALGYQIEFTRGIKEKQVTRFKGDLGIISDDTQMTLFTANALLWRTTRLILKGTSPKPVDAIYLGYQDWLKTQTNIVNNHLTISWIKNIPELNKERTPGITCITALSFGKEGKLEDPINNSKGCGTIMRIAPIGLYLNDDVVGMTAVEVSQLTHGHPLGSIPSYVCATMISKLLNYDMDIEEAYRQSMRLCIEELTPIFSKRHMDYFTKLMIKAVDLSKKNINDIDAIRELGEGWVAEEALAIALYSCLKYKDSFEDAIVCAVNHDGDSDSTGAIAGNIMGTYLGYDSIPDYYKNNVELKDTILEIADDMVNGVPFGSLDINPDEKWMKKYAYCDKNYER